MKTSLHNERIYKRLLELANRRSFEVLERKFSNNINGLCAVNEGVIALNNKLVEKKKNFVLAHEIGHAVLHRNAIDSYLYYNNEQYYSKKEDEANRFANKLLYLLERSETKYDNN